MTVKELAEWLLTFEDQDAIVEVIVHHEGTGYYDQGGTVQTEPFNPEKHTEYTDMRGNQFVTPDEPYFNSRTLLLGVVNG